MKPADFLKQHRDELALYDHMAEAIAKCERIDEVKEIRNRAHAVEVYAAQATNYEAEHKAARIRLRAERRCGELLRESEQKGERRTAANGRPKKASHDVTLSDFGISRKQSSDWQKLAAIPQEDFEKHLKQEFPSTAELLRQETTEAPQIDPDALFVWGRICDFERKELLECKPRTLYRAMIETMREDMDRIVPRLIKWLKQMQGETQ